jgi:hypothetical protein
MGYIGHLNKAAQTMLDERLAAFAKRGITFPAPMVMAIVGSATPS